MSGSTIDRRSTILEMMAVQGHLRQTGEYRKANMIDFALPYIENNFINITRYVYVKLTQRGKDVLSDWAGKNRMTVDDVGVRHHDLNSGYWKFQLWHLAHIFGEHMGLGMEMVFEGNVIYFDIMKTDEEMWPR